MWHSRVLVGVDDRLPRTPPIRGNRSSTTRARLFAERGFGAVTNKDVAVASGITTGALYHYVDSKLDLYVAVHRDMQGRVYGRFVEAVEASATFLGQLDGVLEAAHELNAEDPTLALFVGTVRTDMRRFPRLPSGCNTASPCATSSSSRWSTPVWPRARSDLTTASSPSSSSGSC